jgi:hypothetical protein
MVFEGKFPLDRIKPRERRTRVRTDETKRALSEMIQRFGWVQPLTLDAQYRIIDGQYRYELAKSWKLKTVPVVISNGVSASRGTTDLFHMLANRIVEWDKWHYSETDAILKALDGGLKEDNRLGVVALSEAGPLRDLARVVGWFVAVVPPSLTGSTATLNNLATLLEKNLGSKYQFDAAQLLYIEALRREILDTRVEMISEGDPTGEMADKLRQHLEDESMATATGEALAKAMKSERTTDPETGMTTFSIDPELKFLIRKKDEALAEKRAHQAGRAAAERLKRVPRFSFIALASTLGDYSEEDAGVFYDKATDDELSAEMTRVLDAKRAEPT